MPADTTQYMLFQTLDLMFSKSFLTRLFLTLPFLATTLVASAQRIKGQELVQRVGFITVR